MANSEKDFFPDDYISKDNTTVSQVIKSEPQREIAEREIEESVNKYGVSKPRRIITRARIINDKD